MSSGKERNPEQRNNLDERPSRETAILLHQDEINQADLPLILLTGTMSLSIAASKIAEPCWDEKATNILTALEMSRG